MAEIKNIHLLEGLNHSVIEKLEHGALQHRRFSGIVFKVKEYTEKKVVIQIAQEKHAAGNYFDKKRLIEITHELFDQFIDQKIHVQPIEYVQSPVEVVDGAWIRNKMDKTGTKLKDIVADTGLTKSQISAVVNDIKGLSNVMKALFFYYFKAKA